MIATIIMKSSNKCLLYALIQLLSVHLLSTAAQLGTLELLTSASDTTPPPRNGLANLFRTNGLSHRNNSAFPSLLSEHVRQRQFEFPRRPWRSLFARNRITFPDSSNNNANFTKRHGRQFLFDDDENIDWGALAEENVPFSSYSPFGSSLFSPHGFSSSFIPADRGLNHGSSQPKRDSMYNEPYQSERSKSPMLLPSADTRPYYGSEPKVRYQPFTFIPNLNTL